jgi:Xaa-Pro aminopeptidase
MNSNGAAIIGEAWEIPVFRREEGQRRWKRIRELMHDRQIDCLLIGGSTYNYRSGYGDIRYVSNAIPNSDDAYLIFPYDGLPVLFVWSVLSQYHCEKTSWIEVDHCQATQNGHTYPQILAQRLKDLGLEKGKLGIVDEYSWFVYAYERLKDRLPFATFVDAGEILRAVRRVKSHAELEYVREAAQLADRGWEALRNAVRPGATKFELIAELECAIVKGGAEVGGMNLLDVKQWPDGWGFPLGGSYRKLKGGDIVNCEITPSYGGYYAQLVRPISIGTPPDDFYELLALHKGIYRRAVGELRAGNVAQEIEETVGKWAMEQRKGLSFASPGLQMLDNMFRPPLYMGELEPTMVFMIHAITFPSEADMEKRKGHGGHLIGDTYIITDDKPESLSTLPFDVTIV